MPLLLVAGCFAAAGACYGAACAWRDLNRLVPPDEAGGNTKVDYTQSVWDEQAKRFTAALTQLEALRQEPSNVSRNRETSATEVDVEPETSDTSANPYLEMTHVSTRGFLSLPVEVIEEVIAHMDEPTLLSFAKTQRRHRAISSPVLMRRMNPEALYLLGNATLVEAYDGVHLVSFVNMLKRYGGSTFKYYRRMSSFFKRDFERRWPMLRKEALERGIYAACTKILPSVAGPCWRSEEKKEYRLEKKRIRNC